MEVKKKSKLDLLKALLLSFIVIFLLMFMVLIFGPAEIFFTNVQEFKFVYGEFASNLALYGIGISIVGALLISVFPHRVRTILLSVILAISVAGYVQIMFLNKDLDLLGVNPEGYVVEKTSGIINLIIWSVIVIGMVIFAVAKEASCKKFIAYVSVCLLAIQGIAFGSLFLNAPEEAYQHEKEGSWYLSGEKQYTVSSNKNIIVIVLDYFSNQYLEAARKQYSDLLDGVKDFTYYNNTDCVYFGTFPSLPHMFSAQEVDPSILINDWTKKIWTDEKVLGFYSNLREKNYEINLYTPDTDIFLGYNDDELLLGAFDNLSNAGQDLVVDYKKLEKTMIKLSSFRLLPNLLKSRVYVQLNEYQDIVQQRENSINHNNYVIYEKILENGFSLEEDKNCVIIQHMMGTHAFDTGEDGHVNPNATMEETVKGCMVFVEEYINQLKKLGVYDDATIIVTADHGAPRESQVVFLMKEAGEQHDATVINEAPISLCELLPTIGKAAGVPYEQLGKAVTDIDENEQRERAVWVRDYDPELPRVNRYFNESGDGNENIYREFRYIGNIDDLLRQYDEGPTRIIPMMDSYF